MGPISCQKYKRISDSIQPTPIAANREQLVWGTDWPHPRIEGDMPNAGRLLDLFNAWTPNEATRRRILVDNPVRLYGFA